VIELDHETFGAGADRQPLSEIYHGLYRPPGGVDCARPRDVVLVGSNHCSGTLRVKEFLTCNGHPYSYIDLDRDADVQVLLDRFQVAAADVPVVICRGELVLRNPTNQQIADCLGFNEPIDQSQIRDVVVVGAGPGLAAAAYAASRLMSWCWRRIRRADRPVPARRRTISALTGISGQALRGVCTQAQNWCKAIIAKSAKQLR
jgi:thioredoxin reductase (NADPH)